MFNHTISQTAYSNSLNIAASEQLEGDVEVAISQTIVASAANVEVLVAIDISALQSIVIKSSTNCTVKTNDSGAPDDTITLVAGVPYVWTINSYAASELTADVSKIFVTNLQAAEQTFQLLALTDTP